MRTKPQRRRPRGSLMSAQKVLWAVIQYNWDVIDDHDLDHEIRQKASTSLVQAALAYARVIELYEMRKEVTALEEAVERNGHGRQP
jgi:hypothetical protein